MIKILCVLMRYDYGVKERGNSYEYVNVFLPLTDVFGEENVSLFDFYAEYKSNGKASMNKKLKDIITSEKPFISLFCLFENEFDADTILELKNFTTTIAYFFDDPWRVNYAYYWRKFFNFSTTPDYYMFKKYELEAIKNIIYCPFGYNNKIFQKLDIPTKINVSFIGGFSPYRKWIFNTLKKEGINVHIFGRGWGNKIKYVSTEEMTEIFNTSKINLNISNAIYYDINFVFSSLISFTSIKELIRLKKNKEQIKGRHYEINGCGGFQLSYFIPGLNLAYEIDKEIAVYEDIRNLADEIKFFIKDDVLRNSIADNGYMRSEKEHSAQSYLKRLIEQVIAKQDIKR